MTLNSRGAPMQKAEEELKWLVLAVDSVLEYDTTTRLCYLMNRVDRLMTEFLKLEGRAWGSNLAGRGYRAGACPHHSKHGSQGQGLGREAQPGAPRKEAGEGVAGPKIGDL